MTLESSIEDVDELSRRPGDNLLIGRTNQVSKLLAQTSKLLAQTILTLPLELATKSTCDSYKNETAHPNLSSEGIAPRDQVSP